MNEDNIILGIDPGTTIMGFGIIKATSKEMSLIQMNELQLKKYENHFLKLQKIFERTQEIIDDQGELAYRIERFWKIDSLDDYTIKDVWTSKTTSRTAQKVEENIRYTKLVFPISKGEFWNGNAYNYMGYKEYYYDSLYGSSVFGSKSYDSTVYVIQNLKNNILEFEEAYEVYGKNIGLIYKKDIELNINFGNILDINEGHEFEQILLTY